MKPNGRSNSLFYIKIICCTVLRKFCEFETFQLRPIISNFTETGRDGYCEHDEFESSEKIVTIKNNPEIINKSFQRRRFYRSSLSNFGNYLFFPIFYVNNTTSFAYL